MKRLLTVLVFCTACGGGNSFGYFDRSSSLGGPVSGVKPQEIPVHGSHVILYRHDDDEIEGELIAVTDRIVIVQPTNGAAIETQWVSVREVRVWIATSPDGEPGLSAAWTTLGTLSTLSHGFYLVISLPTWLAAGIPVSILNGRSVTAKATAPEAKDRLQWFARYPQGLPSEAASTSSP